MIEIIVDFTDIENKEIETMEAKYSMLILACEERIDALQKDPAPDTEVYFNGINAKDNPEEWNTAYRLWNEAMGVWYDTRSPEWHAECKIWDDLNAELNAERSQLYKRAEQRQFNELGDNPQNILEDGKRQTERFIPLCYQNHKAQHEGNSFMAVDIVSLGNGKWKLDADEITGRLTSSLYMHFDALNRLDASMSAELSNHIDKAIESSPYIAPRGTPGRGEWVYPQNIANAKKDPADGFNEPIKTIKLLDKCLIKEHKAKLSEETASAALMTELVKTSYPQDYVMPLDKISLRVFENAFSPGASFELDMTGRRKKDVGVIVGINFDSLGENVKISRELTEYDRNVHNAILSLFLAGNADISTKMVYQAMTGNPNAQTPPNEQSLINDAITRCMYTRVYIDCTQEAEREKRNKGQTVYDSALLPAQRMTKTLNGNQASVIHIDRAPPLYIYANSKNQISRTDIKLLNTPGSNTEDYINTRGYLLERIAHMKNPNMSKTIVYNSLYERIKLTAENPGSLRNKKAKIRKSVKEMLDYWKSENHIKAYRETKKGKEIYSVEITL